MDKKEVFIGCPQHTDRFNYNCHPCLVATVSRLFDVVEDLLEEKESDVIEVVADGKVIQRLTVKVEEAPNGVDGASEGSNSPTG